MSIKEKELQINALMAEYSQLKGDSANRGRCAAIKNQVAALIYTGAIFNYLCKISKNISKHYATRYEPDEFITETYLKYFDEYDYTKNDNFFNYFKYFLKCTITNMIKTEHPEYYLPMPSYTDEEGNEFDLGDTRPSEGASPETLSIIQLLSNASKERIDHNLENSADVMPALFKESVSENEAEIRVRFIEYISKMIPCVNQANEHRGKRNIYYRAFATDFYIAASKWSLHSRYDMNENEAFDIMDLNFADWTLTDVCRSFMAFESTPCKTYAEIGVTGRDYANGEIETPFKNGVYAAHFKVSDSAVSQQKKIFFNDIGVLVNER